MTQLEKNQRKLFYILAATISATCQNSIYTFPSSISPATMYRTATKRLLGGGLTTTNLLRFSKIKPTIIPSSYTSNLCTSSMKNQSVNPNQSDPTASSSSTEGSRQHERTKPRIEFQEEQARVLSASLRHVPILGWTEEAMIAGSKDIGVSPSIVGSFSRKDAALVEYFMDESLQLLIERIDSELDLKTLTPSNRISKLIKIRLEMHIPYMSKWPQALSIQANPMNVTTSFKQRAMLVDEIWHGVGDGASDLDWYVKRTILGGVYSTTEIYMLTDDSPGFVFAHPLLSLKKNGILYSTLDYSISNPWDTNLLPLYRTS